jgi:tetratricopeptide (TPR) repeat protein
MRGGCLSRFGPRRLTSLAALVALGLAAVLACAAGLCASPAVDQAKQLMKDGKQDGATTLLLDAVKLNPRDHEADFMLAKLYLKAQDYDKAADYAERAVNLADSVSQYHQWLARASLGKAMKAGMFSAVMAARKGKSEYERAIEIDPANLEARFELCMYYLIAPGIVGGSKDKAKEQASILQSKSPLYGDYAWASYWEKERDLIKAESLFVTAVGIDTSSATTALHGLGYFYGRNEKYDKAADIFKQILMNKPNDLAVVFQLGRMYTATKTNLDEAEAAFKQYLEKGPAPDGPDVAYAHWQLGTVYDLQGKRDSSLVELRKAVDLAPNVKQFKESLKQVEKK